MKRRKNDIVKHRIDRGKSAEGISSDGGSGRFFEDFIPQEKLAILKRLARRKAHEDLPDEPTVLDGKEIRKGFSVPLGKTLHIKTPIGKRTIKEGDRYEGHHRYHDIGDDPDIIFQESKSHTMFDKELEFPVDDYSEEYDFLKKVQPNDLTLLNRYVTEELEDTMDSLLKSEEITAENIGHWLEDAHRFQSEQDDSSAARQLFNSLSAAEKAKVIDVIVKETKMTKEEVSNEIGASVTLGDIQDAISQL
jgi:hypothetical protein